MKHYKKFHIYDEVYKTNIYIYKANMKKWSKIHKYFLKQFNIDIGVYKPLARVVPVEELDFLLFFDKNKTEIPTIVHEAVHIRQMVFEQRGFYDGVDGRISEGLKEAEAYYTEFLVKKLIQVLM